MPASGPASSRAGGAGRPRWRVLIGILVGALCGLVNGLIVTRIGINALIATLGTLTIYRSLTYVTAGTGVTPITDAFAAYGRAADPLLRIQSPFWAMLVLVLIGGWLVARTRFFRQFYFIGGNPRAAQLSGIRVDRLILIGFIIMGALAGLAGVLGAARLNSAVVNAGVGIELKVITATVLGGASLKGGEGTILGGILGVLFIALIENAMIINAVGVFWQGWSSAWCCCSPSRSTASRAAAAPDVQARTKEAFGPTGWQCRRLGMTNIRRRRT